MNPCALQVPVVPAANEEFGVSRGAIHELKKSTKKEDMISTIEIQKSILFVKDMSPHFFFVMMCLARRVEAVIDMTPVNLGIISNEQTTAL